MIQATSNSPSPMIRQRQRLPLPNHLGRLLIAPAPLCDLRNPHQSLGGLALSDLGERNIDDGGAVVGVWDYFAFRLGHGFCGISISEAGG